MRQLQHVCKLMAVHELEKGVGQWCGHIKRGAGCGIYEERPASCRAFHCEWLNDATVPESWRPDKTRFLISLENQGTRIKIQVDENTPGAWRLEPYYSFIKRLSHRSLRGDRVIVCIGQRRIYVFPDKDIDLGPVSDGANIYSGFHETPGGMVSYARVLTEDEAAQISGAPSPAMFCWRRDMQRHPEGLSPNCRIRRVKPSHDRPAHLR